ncbi:hypothetical protein GCM10008942_11220 [Rhizomicrobium electricum]|uniref:DUF465 domain-containing protein n=1 Tax=Rhizomicrobium electricum TaxID=480070 RepID=A0ABP3PC93_9PROT
MTRQEIIDRLRSQRDHFLDEVAELESGKLTRHRIEDTGAVDISKAEAADLKKRAENLSSIIEAYENRTL